MQLDEADRFLTAMGFRKVSSPTASDGWTNHLYTRYLSNQRIIHVHVHEGNAGNISMSLEVIDHPPDENVASDPAYTRYDRLIVGVENLTDLKAILDDIVH